MFFTCENYRFAQCLGWRFLPVLTSFSLVSFCAFRASPHSRFRCTHPNQCLPNILKRLLLALPQIYTLLFHLWKSIDLDSGCLGERFLPLSTFFPLVSSRAFRDGTRSRFRCRDPNQCLPNFLKVLILGLPQIYTLVFHLWKSFDLNSAWVRDPCAYQFSFLLQVLARLDMRHTCALRAGIPTNAYLAF